MAKTKEQKAAEKAAKAAAKAAAPAPVDAQAHQEQTIAHEETSKQAQADFLAAQAQAEADAKAEAEERKAALVDASRKQRWEALVENFKKERPLAYEARKHTGEFDKPPAD